VVEQSRDGGRVKFPAQAVAKALKGCSDRQTAIYFE